MPVDPPPVSAARKVLAVLFYIAAGFAVYATIFSAFMKGSWLYDQLVYTGPLAVVTLVLLLIAISINRHWRWQRTTAVTLFAGAGFMAVVGSAILGMAALARERLDAPQMPPASEFVIGGVLLVAVIAAGAVLFRRAPPRPKPSMTRLPPSA